MLTLTKKNLSPLKPLTYGDRARLYNKAYPKYPPLSVTSTWVYGIWDWDVEAEKDQLVAIINQLDLVQGNWEIGNDYRNKSPYYGAYPNSYVQRIGSMFPDMDQQGTLHLFSGSLQGPGVRVDILHTPGKVEPTVQGDATCLPFRDQSFPFVMADPSYSEEDSIKYGAPHPNKKQVMHEVYRVTQPGGHLVWLDIPKPMYRKSEWRLWGEIGILRSTNHRGRFAFIFERM